MVLIVDIFITKSEGRVNLFELTFYYLFFYALLHNVIGKNKVNSKLPYDFYLLMSTIVHIIN